MRSKNKINNSGEAPSPYLTPIFAKNSKKLPYSVSGIIPLDYTYIFRIIHTKSAGIFRLSTSTYHSFVRLTLSYARCKSTNARHNCFFVWTLCWISVWRMSACSVVLWWALNPACVGACSCSSVAFVVSLRFITAINTFANGGVMAILR